VTVMKHSRESNSSANQRGFSLAEMMVAVAVLLVVIGGVLQLLNQSQQRYVSTANVEDSTAMAREAVDLMARELRLAGYPPPNSYPTGIIVPGTNEQYVAIGGGFLAANAYAVQFEADVGTPAACDGTTVLLTNRLCTSNTGVVSVVDYQLRVPTGGDTGACAGLTVDASLTSPTLMRSQVFKNADGTAPAPGFVPFVSDVMNCLASTSATKVSKNLCTSFSGVSILGLFEKSSLTTQAASTMPVPHAGMALPERTSSRRVRTWHHDPPCFVSTESSEVSNNIK